MDTIIKQQAEDLLESGELEALYQLLEPLLAAKDPYAQLLYSSFSLERLQETDEAFEARSAALLAEASEGGLGEASYRLGVLYLYGDSPDAKKSNDYFERAIAQGHSHTKFTYGFNLFYAASSSAQDKLKGRQLIEQAAREGVQAALDELKLISG
jgi:TPR repeat protein